MDNLMGPAQQTQQQSRSTWRAVLVMGALTLLANASVSATGCAEPQRPYQFQTAPMAREPIEALATALAQAGQPPVTVDPQTGSVHTRWVDTGLHLGQVQSQDATVVRRYSATLARGSFGNEVTLRADEQRCVIRDFTLTEIDVQGKCVPVERLPPAHQTELLHLGQRIQQAMSIP